MAEPMVDFPGGIETYEVEGHERHQCGRCGSSVEYLPCVECRDERYVDHDCGEDCCACLHPELNVPCSACHGRGGKPHCISSPDWCEANPLPGREHVKSSALPPEAWED